MIEKADKQKECSCCGETFTPVGSRAACPDCIDAYENAHGDPVVMDIRKEIGS